MSDEHTHDKDKGFTQLLFPFLLMGLSFVLWNKMDETSNDVKTLLVISSQNTTEITVLKARVNILENYLFASPLSNTTQAQIKAGREPLDLPKKYLPYLVSSEAVRLDKDLSDKKIK